ncbi:hypothetical protein HDU91_006125, partial [Kappamyces sp. JEL0680]
PATQLLDARLDQLAREYKGFADKAALDLREKDILISKLKRQLDDLARESRLELEKVEASKREALDQLKDDLAKAQAEIVIYEKEGRPRRDIRSGSSLGYGYSRNPADLEMASADDVQDDVLRMDSTNLKKYSVWKDIVKREFVPDVITGRIPFAKIDSSTERRIKNGLSSFLQCHCPSIPLDYQYCLPARNTLKQILIPSQLIDAFLLWYKDQEKNGFRSFDMKRKASVSVEATSLPPTGKRPKVETSTTNVPLDLSLPPKPTQDLELTRYNEYVTGHAHCRLLPHSDSLSSQDLAEFRKKVRSWLLLKMRERFPHCVLSVQKAEGVQLTYGVPKQLRE